MPSAAALSTIGFPAWYLRATSAIGNSISFLFIRAHFLDRVALTLDVPTLLDSVRSECELSTCGTVGSDRLKSLVSLLRTSCSTSSGSIGASEVKHPVQTVVIRGLCPSLATEQKTQPHRLSSAS